MIPYYSVPIFALELSILCSDFLNPVTYPQVIVLLLHIKNCELED